MRVTNVVKCVILDGEGQKETYKINDGGKIHEGSWKSMDVIVKPEIQELLIYNMKRDKQKENKHVSLWSDFKRVVNFPW